MYNLVKVGIIGMGGIAESYIRNLIQMENVEIVSAADICFQKAKNLVNKYNLNYVKLYEDYKKMIDEVKIDLVCICTYNTQHAECAIYALNKKLNVLLEKPMCVTTNEAIDIIKAEKKSGKLFAVGMQPRFDENMKMIKKVIESGELGKVYYIQTGGGCRRDIPNGTFIDKKTAGIGVTGDLGCYPLDMVLHAINYPKPLTVSGFKSSYFGTNKIYNNLNDALRFNVEDFSAAFIRLEGDIVIDFRISWAMHMDSMGDTIILGTKGGLRIPSTKCWNGSISGPLKIYKDKEGQQIEVEVPMCVKDNVRLSYKKIKAVVEAIRNSDSSPIPSYEMLYNQVIIDNIIKSAEQGSEVKIDFSEINELVNS
ncbi:Gfo/Idh/MocA family protein [Anaerocolumna chitinilytica]|uniref:Gfo/Idh/MocA family oxidoreductase n=1 Tax=Anaerocolumna chitinilytica TaxID=1727145 RepID=A0A7M3SA63_9FIRM|nr:Gfo/Idh/MocA family oxidoreductase [Anaerocolumna chitinilytica]BCK01481.1 Gfo/Idh/MocA family oxidoreductase [Anaerocolumna chitinilytica]